MGMDFYFRYRLGFRKWELAVYDLFHCGISLIELFSIDST